MVKVNGGPIGPDGVGGSYHNTDSDDRAALWQSLGARQGLLSGGALSAVPGSMAVTVAPFRAAVEERDAAGNGLDRGYHAWEDDDVTVLFDPPAAQARNDAVVVAVADTSAGSGAFGTGVSEAGPQVVVVPGVPGVTTPRADADIQAWVGAGGWFRYADVPVSPGDTEVDMATVVIAADSSAQPAYCRRAKSTVNTVANDSIATVSFGTVVRENRSAFASTPSGITIPEAGYYEIRCQYRWDPTVNAGTRFLAVTVDGSAVASNAFKAFTGAGTQDFNYVAIGKQFDGGEVIAAQAYQDSGAALAAGGDPADTYLEVIARPDLS